MPEPKNIKFFKTEEALRKWYEKNHDKLDELWIGYYKKASGKTGIKYSQAVDQALCFGWIDGITKGIDEEKYCQRYTPRRAKSIWSAVNHKKVAELIKNKQMTPAGLKTYNERDKTMTNMYSFEQPKHELPAAYEKKFKQNKKAWANFQKMPPSYRKPAIWWVISAKQEETKLRRLGVLMDDSENGLRIKQMRPIKKTH
jgi:uncharacterized protein YdeI (YjbR/CyaY-like superfamily)